MAYSQKNFGTLETSLSKFSISTEDNNFRGDTSQPADALHGSILSMRKLDLQLLSRQYWVRSAGTTLYRLKGLCITLENYELLFQSFHKENEAREFAGQILLTLSPSPLHLSGEDALQKLEESWTGCARSSTYSSREPSPMVAQIRISYYISTQWEVVKEISYLAVSEDLLDTLFAYAISSKDLSGLAVRSVQATTSNIPLICEKLQSRSIFEDLTSSITNEILSIRSEPMLGMLYCRKWDDNSWPDSVNESTAEWKIGARPIFDIIDLVYGIVRIGRRDLTDPFIRESSKVIQRPLSPTLWSTNNNLECVFAYNPRTTSDGLDDESQKPALSDMCLFLTSNFDSEIVMEEFAHSFAAAVRVGLTISIERRGELDGKAHAIGYEQISILRDAVMQKSLPLKDTNHDSRTCSECWILKSLLL